MIEIVIFFTFFGLLVVGALVADARGVLPTAEELQAEDEARNERIRRFGKVD